VATEVLGVLVVLTQVEQGGQEGAVAQAGLVLDTLWRAVLELQVKVMQVVQAYSLVQVI
jgi:hypothetical protein